MRVKNGLICFAIIRFLLFLVCRVSPPKILSDLRFGVKLCPRRRARLLAQPVDSDFCRSYNGLQTFLNGDFEPWKRWIWLSKGERSGRPEVLSKRISPYIKAK